MIKKVWQLILQHRLISLAILAVLIGGGYFGYQKTFAAKTETRYVLAQVEKGTIMSTVSGTGQVAVSNQIDLKAKVSGDVIKVNIANGQTIKKDDVIMQLNAKDAQKSVRDAQANLQSARLSLEKLLQPADDLSLLQAQNSLAQAQDSARKADDNITKAYEDSFNEIADAFLDFPTIISSLYDIQYGNSIGSSEISIGRSQDNNAALYNSLNLTDRNKIMPLQTSAINDYQSARANYDATFAAYRSTDRSADAAAIESLLAKTLNMARSIAQAAKSESNYLDTWVDLRTNEGTPIFSQVRTYQNNLSTYTSQTNSHLSALLALQMTIKDNKQTKIDAANTIAEKTASLAKLQAGTDSLDIQSAQLSIQQRINSLVDAQEQYANYTIRAPFDGVVASTDLAVGDSVSSGGAIATLITQQKVATISVNEVDVAKIKVGQKVTLAFDAVSDLSISGNVIDIDSLGTVSQGVVSYNIKIGFDTQDERIKPGMSVSATIITDIKQDILIVGNAAIKMQNSDNYVAVMNEVDATAAKSPQGVVSAVAPENRTVIVGVADDNNTEIVSGLSEGEWVVTKTTTVTAASAQASSQAPSLLQSLGAGGRTGGGAGAGAQRPAGN